MAHHDDMMEAYYAARDSWTHDLEEVTSMYPADVDLYVEDHPAPRLRDFMAAYAYPRDFAGDFGEGDFSDDSKDPLSI